MDMAIDMIAMASNYEERLRTMSVGKRSRGQSPLLFEISHFPIFGPPWKKNLADSEIIHYWLP